MTTFTPARDDKEAARARIVLGAREVPAAAHWFLALHSQPVERVIGAIAWWYEPESNSAVYGEHCSARIRFLWKMIHAYKEDVVAADFLQAWSQEAWNHHPLELGTAQMIPSRCPQAKVLKASGFEKHRLNQRMLLPGKQSRARARRVGDLLWSKKRDSFDQQGVAVRPFDAGDAQPVWDFVKPHGLISRSDFVRLLRRGSLSEFSTVLTVAGQVAGVYLCIRVTDTVVKLPVFLAADDTVVPLREISALLVHAYSLRPGSERIEAMQQRFDPKLNPSALRLAKRYHATPKGELWSFRRPHQSTDPEHA